MHQFRAPEPGKEHSLPAQSVELCSHSSCYGHTVSYPVSVNSMAKGLSILLMFSETRFLVSLMFSIFFLFAVVENNSYLNVFQIDINKEYTKTLFLFDKKFPNKIIRE